MKSRTKVRKALNHEETETVPVDFGSTEVTGIHVEALEDLRSQLDLESRTIKAYRPTLMLGLVEEDVRRTLGVDVIGLHDPYTLLGFKNENWKTWEAPFGSTVLIGGGFEFSKTEDGHVYAYPDDGESGKPSMVMPPNGYYFDNVSREEASIEGKLDPEEDFEEQFGIISEGECKYYEQTSKELYQETDYAIFGNLWPGGFGDIYEIPGPMLEDPSGIRDPEEWIKAHYKHPEYLKGVFELQLEAGLENLERYYQAVGDRIEVMGVSATDFGTQNGLFISPEVYREFYKPFHERINDWIHANTDWKTFFHTDGDITGLMDEFNAAGVDVINPVQFNAIDMDLEVFKERFGDEFVFWGGGVDSQKTLPFGTPSEVSRETQNNVEILKSQGGFVCAPVHNIQPQTPAENIIEFFKSIR